MSSIVAALNKNLGADEIPPKYRIGGEFLSIVQLGLD